MYNEFYNFRETPFQLVPNPRFLYRSSKHDMALTYLEYGLTHKVGFILLTGEVGSGKTTLIRYLLNQIEADVETAVIFNTNVTSAQLVVLILQEFNLEPKTNKARNLELLYAFLIEKYAEKKPVLLIIDEAQNLSRESLEEIRMISNLQSDEELLLQIMLVGQPELKARLNEPGLAQFSQRIGANYHLDALTQDETIKYIKHRLRRSGGDENLFSQKALKAVYNAARGIPRTINLICDSALIYGFADEYKNIEEWIITHVIDELGIISAQKGSKVAIKRRPTKSPTHQNNGLIKRLKSLETRQDHLQMKIDWLLERLESHVEDNKSDLVGQLKQMLTAERERSEALLAENHDLKLKLKSVKRAKTKQR